MSHFVTNSHLIWSVTFLILLEYMHSGRWNSFRHSSTICLLIIVIGLILFVATLLLYVRLKCRVSFKRIPLLLLIGILDFFVITNSIFSLFSCLHRQGVREFWGESREIDGCGRLRESVGKVLLCSRLLVLAPCSVELSLKNTPDGWKPHRCIGRVNTFAAGHLFVRIVDPENEHVLVESKRSVAKWSTNPAETFDFDIPFRVLWGRLNRQYIVRCELWFSPEANGVDEKIAEVIERTNGWF